jgi:hypothetical protein
MLQYSTLQRIYQYRLLMVVVFGIIFVLTILSLLDTGSVAALPSLAADDFTNGQPTPVPGT